MVTRLFLRGQQVLPEAIWKNNTLEWMTRYDGVLELESAFPKLHMVDNPTLRNNSTVSYDMDPRAQRPVVLELSTIKCERHQFC